MISLQNLIHTKSNLSVCLGVHSGEMKAQFNPLTPISDQDKISPHNINTIYINQISDGNKEKYQFRDN